MNAELLLMFTLGCDRAYLFAHPERELTTEEQARLEDSLSQRARGIPAEEARHMLIDGFLREVVETVDDFATRTYLLRRLAGRLGSLEE